MDKNSSACVAAVPVIPHTQGYKRDQIFESDRSENAALLFRRHMLFCFDCGLQARGPSPVLDDAALEFIHGFNHAIFYDIIDIATKQCMSVNSLLHRREN